MIAGLEGIPGAEAGAGEGVEDNAVRGQPPFLVGVPVQPLNEITGKFCRFSVGEGFSDAEPLPPT